MQAAGEYRAGRQRQQRVTREPRWWWKPKEVIRVPASSRQGVLWQQRFLNWDSWPLKRLLAQMVASPARRRLWRCAGIPRCHRTGCEKPTGTSCAYAVRPLQVKRETRQEKAPEVISRGRTDGKAIAADACRAGWLAGRERMEVPTGPVRVLSWSCVSERVSSS